MNKKIAKVNREHLFRINWHKGNTHYMESELWLLRIICVSNVLREIISDRL